MLVKMKMHRPFCFRFFHINVKYFVARYVKVEQF